MAGISAFVKWLLIGLSLAWLFAITSDSLRVLLAIILIVWALAGSLIVSWALVDLSSLAFKDGYYKMAERFGRFALKLDLIVLPLGALFGMEEAPFAAFNSLTVANADMVRGRFETARERFKHALGQCDYLPGAGASLTPVVLTHMAQAEYCLGDFDQADCTLRQSLNLKNNRLSREDLSDNDRVALKMAIAADHHLLGTFLEKRQAYKLAEEKMLKAIESIPSSEFESDIDQDCGAEMRATFVGSLADLYLRSGRVAEAEKLAKEALTIRRERFRSGHPALSASYDTMGRLHLLKNELAVARDFLKKAEKIRRRYCQENHSDLADTLKSLSDLARAEGGDEGLQLLRQALLLKEKTYGKNHPDVAEILEALAAELTSSKEQETGGQYEAAEIAKRAAAIRARYALPEQKA